MSYKINYVSIGELSIPFHHYIGSEENLFTILIGKNGSGKSRVLSAINNVLCSVYVKNKLLKRDIGTVSQYKQDEYYLSISGAQDGDGFRINVKGRSIFFEGCGEVSKICPKKIISASTSPFNKFPEESIYFSENNVSANFYKYYGLDDKSKNRALLSLVQRVFFSINDGFLTKNRCTVKKLLNFLGLDECFEIHFRMKYGINKFMANLESLNVRDFMNYISSASQRDLSYLHSKYDITYTKLRDAFLTLNDYCVKHDFSRVVTFVIDNTSLRVDQKSKEFISAVKILSDIGLFNVHDIIVSRKTTRKLDGWQWWSDPTEPFSINDASSGQQCMLLNILGIASSIEDNALILIDEPEISLHPEWQENYIQLLIDSFTHVKGCHFIIATHSPQIVAKLKNKNCFVSLIEHEEVVPARDIINKSADFQLATLFDAPGVENEYLKRVAVNILSAFSKGTYSKELYASDLDLLMKNRDKVEQGDSVKQLIDLTVEIAERFIK
ncbi:AAA family ATPase [Enterobacteriaceae bacterium 8376wB9]|nr:AAA family ATPase [Enterobacteriaceae bacterium 8376wB9]